MTNRITSPALGLLLRLTLLLGLAAQPAAAGNRVAANLRVVTWKGQIIFDGKVKTGTAKIKPNDDCLGGHAGPARTVTGPTALAACSTRHRSATEALQPLKISDGDFGFGICGIADVSAKKKSGGFSAGTTRTRCPVPRPPGVQAGDTILLYLARTYEGHGPGLTGAERSHQGKEGARVKVRVFSFTGAGKRTPVEGPGSSAQRGVDRRAGIHLPDHQRRDESGRPAGQSDPVEPRLGFDPEVSGTSEVR